MPKRIQLRRTKGWRKPAGAIVVARPTLFGNPFTVAKAREACFGHGTDEQLRAYCVSMFHLWLAGESGHGLEGIPSWDARRQTILDALPHLRGHDLACWCPLDQPCHADVLLKLAN